MAAKPKAAELSAGLLARKGAAAPAPDMAPRASAPVEPVEVAAAETDANDAPLNFRVSADFRRRFRMFAAAHDLKLNALLVKAFDAYAAAEAESKRG